MFHGSKTVTTAGTEVALGTARRVARLTIQALPGNTGYIYVGAGAVVASNDYGVRLSAGDSLTVGMGTTTASAFDLSEISIDSSVNGEGVTYFGEEL